MVKSLLLIGVQLSVQEMEFDGVGSGKGSRKRPANMALDDQVMEYYVHLFRSTSFIVPALIYVNTGLSIGCRVH